MYVKIDRTHPLGVKIQEMWDRSRKCNKAAFNWAVEQGANFVRQDYFTLGGGVTSAGFTQKPPKGWVKAGAKYPDGEYLISSSATGKELRKYEQALPRVTYDEFNEVIKYDPDLHTGRHVSFCPGIDLRNPECILLHFADHTPYTPVEGMEEITVTEWKSLRPAEEDEDSDDE